MAFPEKLAQHLTYSFIKENLPDKEQKELDRIEYGLASFFIAFPKLVVLFSIAVFLSFYIDNFIIYFAIVQVSYALVRAYAWGMHLKTDLGCLFGSFIVLFGITLMGVFYPLPLVVLLLLWGISIGLLYRYAPAATEARPLRSMTLRKKLRKKLLIITSLLFIAAFINAKNPYGTLITLSVLGESLFTTPLMYKLFQLKGGETNEKN
ncbi:accessory gene regulator ArgB-like protein [Clostridium formicaceticum]|uniref:Accessory gene regulator protein B n=1 Tax=Clostridium formicaceticum TaxID=1497 RepID=A0AAC9RIY2_9CLOT|nr:accessory gene regulator B family protein [Clostridium formicaceticum]AOY75956.1 hypothetical protein BJL90_08630 [Clostridium formicaceticum]ARE86305.1 Accessory gene regulator protein B [Clostridium formicaceticum]